MCMWLLTCWYHTLQATLTYELDVPYCVYMSHSAHAGHTILYSVAYCLVQSLRFIFTTWARLNLQLTVAQPHGRCPEQVIVEEAVGLSTADMCIHDNDCEHDSTCLFVIDSTVTKRGCDSLQGTALALWFARTVVIVTLLGRMAIIARIQVRLGSF